MSIADNVIRFPGYLNPKRCLYHFGCKDYKGVRELVADLTDVEFDRLARWHDGRFGQGNHQAFEISYAARKRKA